MHYLSVDEVIAINQAITQERGEVAGVLSQAGIEEAIQRPALAIEDYEPFPTLWQKAAVLMDTLLKNKPFPKANIRTSLIAADVMLRMNGHALQCSAGDADQIRSMALLQMTLPQIAEWMKLKSREIQA